MAFEWKFVFEAAKLSLRYVLAVGVSLGVILFFPDSFIDRLGLLTFRQQYQPYLGAAFLLSVAILCTDSFGAVAAWARKLYRERMTLREARTRLKHLTPEEQALLRGYLEGQTKTANFLLSSGVVAGLSEVGIIYRSTNHGRGHDPRFDHNIADWAWDYLHEHPEFIGLTSARIDAVRATPPEPKPRRALLG